MISIDFNELATSTLSSLLATLIIAAIAYIFRAKIKRLLRASTLKSKNQSPSMSLEVDFAHSAQNEPITTFVVENTGSIELSGIRVFLCSYNSPTSSLVVERIKVDGHRKWINSGGHRLQINTRSLHEGCNAIEDQRYFVEFIDDNDGTIYRLARGAPSPKDGAMPFYGTAVCRKRLPRRGINIVGKKKVKKAVEKYDVDLAVG